MLAAPVVVAPTSMREFAEDVVRDPVLMASGGGFAGSAAARSADLGHFGGQTGGWAFG